MEPRDRKQLSQADQDEHATQLADRLADQYRGAMEGTAPEQDRRGDTTSPELATDAQIRHFLAPLEARIEALERRLDELAGEADTAAEIEEYDSGEA
jgi:hypothetical protein